jgi:hypothetical protein
LTISILSSDSLMEVSVSAMGSSIPPNEPFEIRGVARIFSGREHPALRLGLGNRAIWYRILAISYVTTRLIVRCQEAGGKIPRFLPHAPCSSKEPIATGKRSTFPTWKNGVVKPKRRTNVCEGNSSSPDLTPALHPLIATW